MSNGYSYLQSVFRRIDDAAKILQLKPYMIKELKTFAKILELRVRVNKQHFTAYRVCHVNPYATGHRPYKGGLRFDRDTGGDLNTIKALAVEMTLKCATVGPDQERRIPFGGAKGGIGINAKSYSPEQIRAIVEKFVDEMGENLGPTIDVPAPDYGTNEEIMRLICTRYCKFHPHSGAGAVVTGKPLSRGGGGCPGRREATGLGMLFVYKTLKMLDALPKTMADVECPKAIVHGFGNVGSHFAAYAGQFGIKIVGIAELDSALYNPNGISIQELMSYFKKNKTIAGFANAHEIKFEDLIRQPHEIDAPCAKENSIDNYWAENTTASLIIEGANGPCLQKAEEIFTKRGIVVIPDLLANAGGVTVSYFEWQQDIEGAQYDKKTVFEQLEKYMRNGTEGVVKTAKEYQTNLRISAYIWAIKYLNDAICAKHGW